MVEVIKLFETPFKQAVETVRPLDRNPGCTRCANSRRPGLLTTCMAADGEPGGLLVVTDYPTRQEDAKGRPFVSETGLQVRQLVAKHWSGPVVWDNAVRCAPGDQWNERAPEACRPFMSAVIRDAKPTRIIALGTAATEVLLGRRFNSFTARRGFAYLSDGTPVFYTFGAVAAFRNKLRRAAFEKDIEWILTHEPPFPPMWDATARVVNTEADALEAERALRDTPWFSFDVETAGRMYSAFQILCAALFPTKQNHGWVWSPEGMHNPGAVAVLKRLLESPIGKVGNNIKFDFEAAECALDARVRGLHGDNRLIRKVIQADASADLETMSELVGMGGSKAEAQDQRDLSRDKVRLLIADLHGKQTSIFRPDVGFLDDDVIDSIPADLSGDEIDGFSYGLLPRPVLLRYVCRDSLASRLLQEHMESELAAEEPELTRTWTTVVRPAAEAIRQVEQWGVAVDRNAVNNFEAYLTNKLSEVNTKMLQWGTFEPTNARSIGKHLFETLKLKGAVQTPSGQYATDAETLAKVAQMNAHPLPGLIIQSKQLEKKRGTYAVAMLRHVRDDGRIHTRLLLDGAETGRLSSQEPNLQNIPRDADTIEGKMARDIFVAPPGYVFLSADYSQLELRIAAMLSGDEEMARVFIEGHDFHQRTAEFIAPMVWGIKPEQVQKKHRSAAKSFNFGILYGMGDAGIAHKAGCSVEEAAKIRAAVLGRFHRLAAFIAQCERYTKKTGVCWTWWDGHRARRRPLWEIADADEARRGGATNSAFNTPVQGTGSDFCLMSLTAVVQWIKEDAAPAKLVLPVHDSLLLEVREDAFDEAVYAVRRIMTGWNSRGVPLAVDMEKGYAWGSLVKLK